MKINSIIIDSSNSITDLCLLGKKYPTDKCPYNEDGNLHKHAYTAIYNLLFSSIRYKFIRLGEIGILDNNSMKMWREYFPYAELYGYEWEDILLERAREDKLLNTNYIKMDISDCHSIEEGLEPMMFDVLIDDSTHQFEHQINFINTACKYVASGGMLIVEDIFINADEEKYRKRLHHLREYFSSATFIFAEHILKYSPGWNNDKLLVLHRNYIPYKEPIKLTIITPCSRPENLFAIEESMNTIPRCNRRWIVVFDREEVPENIPASCEPYAIKDKESVFGNAQRNYGLNLVEGGWIYFNDDDTTIHPDLWDNIKDTKEDFVSFMQINKDGSIKVDGKVIAPSYTDSGNFIIAHKCIGNIRWDIKRYDADGQFAQDCYHRTVSRKHIPLPLSIYNSLK